MALGSPVERRRQADSWVWSSGEVLEPGRGIWELVCVPVFLKATDACDITQGEDIERMDISTAGTSGHYVNRVA